MAVIDPPSGSPGAEPGPGDGHDPVESSDATTGVATLDLSPRVRPARHRGRGWAAKVALVAVLVGAGFVVSKALTSASLFFYNADEAVAKEHTLGTSTFRIQGTVEDDVKRTATGADFTITYDGVEVPVDHTGDPPQLFKPGEPVVLQGHWDANGQKLFLSDQMLVKHDATYTAQHGDRLKQADTGGKVAPKSTTTAPASPSTSIKP